MNQGTGGSTMDVPQTSDGYADTSVQDTFCSGTTCTVSILYDQSGNGNDLKSAPSGPAGNGSSGTADYESSATKLSVTAGGHKVYALYMNAVEGYRTGLNVKGKNMPGMNMDEGIYELADGTHYGTACCWDFGNVTTNPAQYHTMNTIFFGTGYWGKGASGGAKPGPWFEADFEGGVWAGGSSAGDPGGSMEPWPTPWTRRCRSTSPSPRSRPASRARRVLPQSGQRSDGDGSDDRLQR